MIFGLISINMKICLLVVGKLKDSFYHETCAHYIKLLTPFCKLEIKEISDEAIGKNAVVKDVQTQEGKRILANLHQDYTTVVLDERGKMMDSAAFARWIAGYDEKGESLQFVIGGPYGLSEEVKSEADILLGLSELTLPHQLARTVFLEQLYRAFTILKGKKYHY